MPSDTPPCYDENGLRLGHNDRAVHQPNDEEWLFGIAQQYRVCMADLFAANPLLQKHPQQDLPSIIFIPDTPPCAYRNADGFIEHLVREPEISKRSASQTYINIAYMYNVCPIDIVLANPQFVVGFPDELDNFAAYFLRKPQIGEILFIPSGKRPCYDFDVPLSGVGNYGNYWSRSYPSEIAYLCLFQNRYKSIVCDEDGYFTQLVRYIHLNPIRAGLVKDLRGLERYPWSGHSTVMGKVGRGWQDRRYVLSWFGKREGKAVLAYHRFVADGLGEGRRPDLVGGGLVRSLGDGRR